MALALAGFTMVFGARHLDSTERHEGLVAAIAFESVVKLVAFLAVGVFVVYGMFNGLEDLFARALAVPRLASLLRLEQVANFAWTQWFAPGSSTPLHVYKRQVFQQHRHEQHRAVG